MNQWNCSFSGSLRNFVHPNILSMLPPWRHTALIFRDVKLKVQQKHSDMESETGVVRMHISCKDDTNRQSKLALQSHLGSPWAHVARIETGSRHLISHIVVRDWHMSPSVWLSQWVSFYKPWAPHWLIFVEDQAERKPISDATQYFCAAANSGRTSWLNIGLGSDRVLLGCTTTRTEPITQSYFKNIHFKKEKDAAPTQKSILQL